MGQVYISSVKLHAPNAKLVIGWFHVVKRFNEKLTNFRCELQNIMTDKTQDLKNTHWLLASTPDKLDERGKEKLARALEANQSGILILEKFTKTLKLNLPSIKMGY